MRSVELLLTASLPPFLAEPLAADYSCHDYHAAPDKRGMLAAVGARIRGLVMGGVSVIPEELLDVLPRLEIISVFGVGYDGVPIDYCRRRGIKVTNTPDVLTEDVADVAAALVLMSGRGFAAAERFVRRGEWRRRGPELTARIGGRRAGIVGLGRIGKAIAQRLAAFGMDIAYTGRSAQPDVPWRYVAGLAALAAEVDFLIVACPGGAATRGLVDAQVLAALGAKGTLINIARGSIVDEPALVDALQRGVIRAAGLDVFADEPNVPPALLEMENVVLLPHVGSATRETRQAMADLCRGNLDAWFAGQPPATLVPELR
jgi:lactate dehydrogenase-like 2-hydroxyacid dehydrogenase